MHNKSIFNLNDWSSQAIDELLNMALSFKQNPQLVDFQQKKVVANLFFEPSTRTHYSFDIAANKLGCKTINFNEKVSSTQKGETLYDTVKTFEAIGVDALVIRHPQNQYYLELENINVPILNGGDGSGDHPTQSLLDLLTIKEEFQSFRGLKIVIVGDIKHSRVAKTNIKIMQRLGMEVCVAGPAEFQIAGVEMVELEDVIDKVDVVMLLRYQFERFSTNEKYHLDYLRKYKLTEELLHRMQSNSIIMHPAPFNRGVEIDSTIVEAPNSRIFRQMENGVFVRMALLNNALQ